MKRSLWLALLFGGASLPALAQEADSAPAVQDPPAADAAPDAGTNSDVAPDAAADSAPDPAADFVPDAAADPAENAGLDEPIDPALDSDVDPGLEAPIDPALDSDAGAESAADADPGAPPPVRRTPEIGNDDVTPELDAPADDPALPSDAPRNAAPAGDADSVRPGRDLEGAEPAEPGLPGSPPALPRPGSRGGAGPSRGALPDTILDAVPRQDNDLPADEAPPAIDAREADGQGAPLVDEGTIPAPAPSGRRAPIERQPLPPDADLSEPLLPNGGVTPPPPRRRPVIDPAYGAPAPPRPQPQIPIGDVVANPIRVHEARLLVLMGHVPAATKAVDTLSHRFPTDARVPYLRYYLLSRTGRRDDAIEALRQAVTMERLYPVIDYNRFMEPLQGADRVYAERVRRAAAELAAVDGLVEPNPDEILPGPNGAAPAPANPGASPSGQPLPGGVAPPSETLPPEQDPPGDAAQAPDDFAPAPESPEPPSDGPPAA